MNGVKIRMIGCHFIMYNIIYNKNAETTRQYKYNKTTRQ